MKRWTVGKHGAAEPGKIFGGLVGREWVPTSRPSTCDSKCHPSDHPSGSQTSRVWSSPPSPRRQCSPRRKESLRSGTETSGGSTRCARVGPVDLVRRNDSPVLGEGRRGLRSYYLVGWGTTGSGGPKGRSEGGPEEEQRGRPRRLTPTSGRSPGR